MSIAKKIATTVSLAFALIANIAAACPINDSCQYDIERRAWYGGVVVHQFVRHPSASSPAPSPTVTDADLYIIGPINANDPFATQQQFPALGPDGQPVIGPDGQPVMITMPNHEHVWVSPSNYVRDGFGHFVVAGLNGNVSNLRTRPMPMNSLAGAPLAYQVKLGNTWYYLNSYPVIQVALSSGIVKLNELGWGGVAWFEFYH